MSSSGSEQLQHGHMVYYNFQDNITAITGCTGQSQVVANTQGEVVAVDHFSYQSGDLVELKIGENDELVLCCVLGAHAFEEEAIDAAKNYLRRLARWDGTCEKQAVAMFDIDAMSAGSQVPGLYDGIVGDSDATNYSDSE